MAWQTFKILPGTVSGPVEESSSGNLSNSDAAFVRIAMKDSIESGLRSTMSQFGALVWGASTFFAAKVLAKTFAFSVAVVTHFFFTKYTLTR